MGYCVPRRDFLQIFSIFLFKNPILLYHKLKILSIGLVFKDNLQLKPPFCRQNTHFSLLFYYFLVKFSTKLHFFFTFSLLFYYYYYIIILYYYILLYYIIILYILLYYIIIKVKHLTAMSKPAQSLFSSFTTFFFKGLR